MTYQGFHSSPLFRRMLFGVRVNFLTRRTNRDIERAFSPERTVFADRAWIFSSFAFMAVLGYALVNFTFVNETTAKIAPLVEIDIGSRLAPIVREPLATADLGKATSDNDFELDAGADRAIASLIPDFSDLPPLNVTPSFPERTGEYTLVVDKMRGLLLVLKDAGDRYQIVEKYNVSLGSQNGDKFRTGDKRTPEGVYHIVRVREDHELPSKYGPRAFVLNYPNEVDTELGKTGSGIWIHGSGLGVKTEPTEGCVEVNDKDIIDLGVYAGVGSMVYIFPEKFQVPVHDGAILKTLIRPRTLYGIKQWLKRVITSKAGNDGVATGAGHSDS